MAVGPGSAVAVRIEKMTTAAPQWVAVATITTDAGGAAQFAVTPLVSTSYRVVFIGTGVASNVITVNVNRSWKKKTR
jgi:hypothetical protein